MRLEDIPVICISLERRADRWAKFQRYAGAAGVTPQRQIAVDAKSFVAHEHPAITLGVAHNVLFKTRRSHYEIDGAGAIGCSLSHIEAWKRLQASQAPAYLIFEDDTEMPADFRKRLEQLLKELPADWDAVHLQKRSFVGDEDCKPIPGSAFQHCTSLMGSWAYLVSRQGAEKLLKRCLPIEMHIDAYMAYMSRMNHIKLLWHPLFSIPAIVDDSDINHGNNGIILIPTNLKKHGVVAMKMESVLGLAFMAAVVGGIVTLAYAARPRR
jgi:GR25 family glycosyltransferase involved in LPS biosynthesis